MTAHASAPPFASNHVRLLMVGDAHVQTPLIHSLSSFSPCLASVEGVGEDSMEDKPYCDVAMEEVIPAVKTLIRAVR